MVFHLVTYSLIEYFTTHIVYLKFVSSCEHVILSYCSYSFQNPAEHNLLIAKQIDDRLVATTFRLESCSLLIGHGPIMIISLVAILIAILKWFNKRSFAFNCSINAFILIITSCIKMIKQVVVGFCSCLFFYVKSIVIKYLFVPSFQCLFGIKFNWK